jgi:hypothetical protein
MWLALVTLPLGAVQAVAFAASKTSSAASTKGTAKTTSKAKAKTIAKCNSNYSKCVPIASDVDCKPGKGNGPKYISTPVKVLKKDVYRLDADHDRIGCEKN